MRTLFERWADEQGVRRAFDALVEMDEPSRHQIAEHLDVELTNMAEDAPELARWDLGAHDAPRLPQNIVQAEACLIIARDGFGIQARSHSTLRTLNVFTRNHTWLEVLLSVVNEFEIPLPDDPTESNLEAAIFEHVADKAWEQMDPALKEEIEAFLERETPEFRERLRKAGVGPKGIRLMAAGVFTAAKAAGFGSYITAVKAAAFLNKRLGANLAMQSVTKGLATVLRGLNVLLWITFVGDILGFLFGSSRGRLLFVIAEIHQHNLLRSLSAEPDRA